MLLLMQSGTASLLLRKKNVTTRRLRYFRSRKSCKKLVTRGRKISMLLITNGLQHQMNAWRCWTRNATEQTNGSQNCSIGTRWKQRQMLAGRTSGHSPKKSVSWKDNSQSPEMSWSRCVQRLWWNTTKQKKTMRERQRLLMVSWSFCKKNWQRPKNSYLVGRVLCMNGSHKINQDGQTQ